MSRFEIGLTRATRVLVVHRTGSLRKRLDAERGGRIEVHSHDCADLRIKDENIGLARRRT
jgi:hypothetical protein